MVVDIDSDCACAVEAHNDARETHAARRLQDAQSILTNEPELKNCDSATYAVILVRTE